jgi:hypothetical protein
MLLGMGMILQGQKLHMFENKGLKKMSVIKRGNIRMKEIA